MKLLTNTIAEQLRVNGEKQRDAGGNLDLVPVVKLFTPDGAATWLLTHTYPNHPDIAFGLCDLGMGFPELGDVRISELESVRGVLGLPVERDLHFNADKTISEYGSIAIKAQRITV